ncbi:MAG TPA: sigma 54 modulation/S30EA ribosomal C-terminal domain-containing protein [Thermoleophilaceae bacterium]|nr:sigma 54 modulation/S30EA ribosomal C-terminal domain-containing protein [Thermoleophilaceae bacterium]
MSGVQLRAEPQIPKEEAEAARERVDSVLRVIDEPPPGTVRLTLRRGEGSAPRWQYVADADVRVNGRVLAAHATGPSAVEAADRVAARLRRQLRRVVGTEVAQRNEPANIRTALESLLAEGSHRPEAGLKPPEAREIVHRIAYPDEPSSTLAAVADLIDHDHEFLIFRHARTGEDAVVYRRADGEIGLLHPPGSELADENDLVIPEPSRYTEPISLARAREEMDVLNHRFLYFIDEADGRGRVIYLRHDGDYGLVEPE